MVRFKQTPAVEASLVYGISLLLSFVVFLIFSTLSSAMNLAQWLAALILMPTWVLMVVVGQFTKKGTKYRRFFGNVSVLSVIAIAVGAFIIYANNSASGASATALKNFSNTFTLLDLTYYITGLIGVIVTNFVIFKAPPARTNVKEFGALPVEQVAKPKKPTRPAPPAKPKRNK